MKQKIKYTLEDKEKIVLEYYNQSDPISKFTCDRNINNRTFRHWKTKYDNKNSNINIQKFNPILNDVKKVKNSMKDINEVKIDVNNINITCDISHFKYILGVINDWY